MTLRFRLPWEIFPRGAADRTVHSAIEKRHRCCSRLATAGAVASTTNTTTTTTNSFSRQSAIRGRRGARHSPTNNKITTARSFVRLFIPPAGLAVDCVRHLSLKQVFQQALIICDFSRTELIIKLICTDDMTVFVDTANRNDPRRRISQQMCWRSESLVSHPFRLALGGTLSGDTHPLPRLCDDTLQGIARE